jgi:hypothetical protein
MADEFIYCPNCGSGNIEDTDYEVENGVDEDGGRTCVDCHWEGASAELVCK